MEEGTKPNTDMNLESLIQAYGYVVILIGTFVEGETVLVLGGFIAHRGYLHLPWVITAAFAGSICGDQLFFFLGRRHSEALLRRRPSWKNHVEKVRTRVDRFGTPFILIFRFLYGLRTVAPFVIGMSTVPAPRFVLLNAVGALVWAVAVGCGGYLFGEALEAMIGDLKHYEMIILGAIAAIGTIFWGIHFVVRSRFRQKRLKPVAG